MIIAFISIVIKIMIIIAIIMVVSKNIILREQIISVSEYNLINGHLMTF